MTAVELADKLGVDVETIDGWIKDGLPHTGKGKRREFDPEQVSAWLVANGRAQQRNLVSTLQAVTDHFGVSRRQVTNWVTMGMPGTEGNYDLDEIAAWREARTGNVAESAEADDEESGPQTRSYWEARKAKAAAELAELKALKLAERVIDVDAPKRIVTQLVSTFRTHLEQFPDRLAGMMPAKIENASQVRSIAERAVQDLIRSLHNSVVSAREHLDDGGEDAA